MSKNQAIVIGINEYNYLPPLNYAKHDAELVKKFFGEEAGLDRVYLFSDDSPPINGKNTQPTRNNLRRALREIFERPFMSDGDNFWFFFSGHGIRHEERDYLMPIDGDPGDIENTAIPTNYITEHLSRCGADNIILIFDCCRNRGTKSGEGIGRQTEQEIHRLGMISIFSCSPNEYSYEIEELGQGAFTYALLEGFGLTGRCGTIEQLDAYLTNRVPNIVHQHKKAQQVPYIRVEPLAKSHLILLPKNATPKDIITLKHDAYRAENIQRDSRLAEQLWIRVLSAGTDMDAIEALKRLGRIDPNSSPSPQPPKKGTETVLKSIRNNPTSSLLPQSPVKTRTTTLPISIKPKFSSFKGISRHVWLVIFLIISVWVIVGVFGYYNYKDSPYQKSNWAALYGGIGGGLDGLITAIGLQETESSFRWSYLRIFVIAGATLGAISWFIIEWILGEIINEWTLCISSVAGAIIGILIFCQLRWMR